MCQHIFLYFTFLVKLMTKPNRTNLYKILTTNRMTKSLSLKLQNFAMRQITRTKTKRLSSVQEESRIKLRTTIPMSASEHQ